MVLRQLAPWLANSINGYWVPAVAGMTVVENYAASMFF
jgi:hypothetical protein